MKKINLVLATFFIALTFVSPTKATNTVLVEAKSTAKVTKLLGSAEISEKNKWLPLKKDSSINMYHRIRTLDKSRLEMVFSDGSKLRLSEKSSIMLTTVKTKNNSIFSLDYGRIWANIKNKGMGRVAVKSNTAVLAVMGTVFDVQSDSQKTEMYVIEGSVGVQAIQKEVDKIDDSIAKLKLNVDDIRLEKKTVDLEKPNVSEKPQKISKPFQIKKPVYVVPGPYKVTLDKWLEIVENQKIIVDINGKAIVSTMENDKLKKDEWVSWNKKLDVVVN